MTPRRRLGAAGRTAFEVKDSEGDDHRQPNLMAMDISNGISKHNTHRDVEASYARDSLAYWGGEEEWWPIRNGAKAATLQLESWKREDLTGDGSPAWGMHSEDREISLDQTSSASGATRRPPISTFESIDWVVKCDAGLELNHEQDLTVSIESGDMNEIEGHRRSAAIQTTWAHIRALERGDVEEGSAAGAGTRMKYPKEWSVTVHQKGLEQAVEDKDWKTGKLSLYEIIRTGPTKLSDKIEPKMSDESETESWSLASTLSSAWKRWSELV